MGFHAITLSDHVEYVSDLDPAKTRKKVAVDPQDPAKGMKDEVKIADGATKFILKPLDVFLKGYIYDNATSLSGRQGDDTVGINTRMNQTNIDAVRFGLAGFVNWKDSKGKEVPFKTSKAFVNGREYDAVVDEVLNGLGIRLIAELAGQIKELNEVGAEEEKNSV